MRPDIGRPCQGTAISMASSHKQGMATLICREARNDLHILTVLDLHLVHPKQGGPWCVEPRHDGMRRHLLLRGTRQPFPQHRGELNVGNTPLYSGVPGSAIAA